MTHRLTLACLLFCAVTLARADYSSRPEVQAFMDELVARHGFQHAELVRTLTRARFQPAIVDAMTPPVTGQRNWKAYRARAVSPARVESGLKFWAQHRATLARAHAEYGVPEELIVSIIGIETEYGRNMGGYRVIDALTTLAFDYPRRAPYFRAELEQYFLHTRESRVDPLSLRGSYAGAVGIPQFMPAAYRRYAVDFDRDGRRDLLGSPADAIGSVANFLVGHGWERGQPIVFSAEVTGAAHWVMLAAGVDPAFRASDLADFGVQLAANGDMPPQDDAAVALVELESPGEPSEFRIGMRNFYVITRYNQSSFYAIAVHDLARALRAARR